MKLHEQFRLDWINIQLQNAQSLDLDLPTEWNSLLNDYIAKYFNKTVEDENVHDLLAVANDIKLGETL